MTVTTGSELAEACGFWQAGRDRGSSLLRAAARVITGVPHYFCADYLHQYEFAARRDPVSLAHASTLLNEVGASPFLAASQWAQRCSVSDQSFAGRGLAPNPGNDDEIEQRLDEGVIEMPLWGVTLDRKVAAEYGSRFLLEIVGSFPAIPAWLQSHHKAEEQELVAGGRYEVDEVHRSNGLTHARLRWTSPLEPRLICAHQREGSSDPSRQ
ncbi:hypothetical protein GCM10009616_28670 [Microlunatus lacustris]